MTSSLLLDLYELTMLAGYHRHGMEERSAVFDLFFRHNPFGGGYALFAGLDPALDRLERLRFDESEIVYLRSLGLFDDHFLAWLKEFRFRGDVIAAREGEVVFPGEPILTVVAPLGQAQIVETALLNLINSQTLVATKAARIALAAGEGGVMEFGARRAHGPDGALGASRAAFVGGARSTSHLAAGQRFAIPVAGTQAHSWIMAFPTELEAFRAYADVFPDECVLLVDTYDTIRSGVPNAIVVARELRAKGHELRGVRIDSGDLARLSKEARQTLDDAGFPQVVIVASNELDEHIIESIRREGGRVDQWGVGTRLVTGAGEPSGALGAVYKLVEFDGRPRIKLSSDRLKSTIPGRKRLWRVLQGGRFTLDVQSCWDESPGPGEVVFDPAGHHLPAAIPRGARFEDLRSLVMSGGTRVDAPRPLESVAAYARDRLSALPEGCRRLLNPHLYQVLMTRRLFETRESMIEEVLHEGSRDPD